MIPRPTAQNPSRPVFKVSSALADSEAAAGSQGGLPRRRPRHDDRTSADASATRSRLPTEATHDSPTDMPINEFTLSRKLPAGITFHSIDRIRTTLNRYTSRLVGNRCCEPFRLGTTQALARSFSSHEKNMVGRSNVDLEIAFVQMSRRINDVLDIYKIMKAWVDSQNDDTLIDILPILSSLKPFIEITNQAFGAEIQLLSLYATYRLTLQENDQRVDIAMSTIDWKVLCRAQEDFASYQAPAEGEHTADNPDADACKVEPDDEDDGEPEPAPKAGAIPNSVAASNAKTAKAAMAKKHEMVYKFVNGRLLQPADRQLSRLACDAITSKLFCLPVDLADDNDAMVGFIQELNNIRAKWGSLTSSKADSEFMQFIEAIRLLTECLLQDESARPSVASVRAARKLHAELVRPNTLEGEVAMAVATYPLGQEHHEGRHRTQPQRT